MSTTSPFDDEEAIPSGNMTATAPVEDLSHPYAVIFHFFFRTAAVLSYLLCTWFSDSFAMTFIVIVLLLSLDFWTVKNVSGRLLVGLRWWNQVDEEGSSKWVFESRKGGTSNSREKRLFWWSLYIYCLVWSLFAITSLLHLSFAYLLIVLVALALNLANVVGYTKCEKNAKANITKMAGDYLGKHFLSQAISGLARLAGK